MADQQTCVNFVLDNEDARRLYAVEPDPTHADPSARAISGINSHFWPTQFARILSIPQAARGSEVAAFYVLEYFEPWVAQLEDTALAARVMDAEVNEGAGVGVRCLQEALNDADRAALVEDCVWGPETVGAANATTDPVALAMAFRTARDAAYQALPGVTHAMLTAYLARAAR
jgi:hypothetical protein